VHKTLVLFGSTVAVVSPLEALLESLVLVEEFEPTLEVFVDPFSPELLPDES
jgi:hypothetical protein